MLFGSHNSWSFRSPAKWWQKPLHFLARCQEKDIQSQFKDYNIRLFDLRIKFDDKQIPHIHHGFIDFGLVKESDLEFFNENKCHLRLVLESNSEMKDQAKQEELFINYCKMIETEYPDIVAFGGNRKYDWKVIYTFKNPDTLLIDRYSSTTTLFDSDNKFLRIADDWCPIMYAKLKNHDNYMAYINDESMHDKCFFYDFVDIK